MIPCHYHQELISNPVLPLLPITQGILDHLVQRIVEILPVSGAGVTLISPMSAPHYVAASNEAGRGLEQAQAAAGHGPCYESYVYARPVTSPDS